MDLPKTPSGYLTELQEQVWVQGRQSMQSSLPRTSTPSAHCLSISHSAKVGILASPNIFTAGEKQTCLPGPQIKKKKSNYHVPNTGPISTLIIRTTAEHWDRTIQCHGMDGVDSKRRGRKHGINRERGFSTHRQDLHWEQLWPSSNDPCPGAVGGQQQGPPEPGVQTISKPLAGLCNTASKREGWNMAPDLMQLTVLE